MTRFLAIVRRCTTAPLLALIWIYQHLISPLTPPTCRFYPSCSTYAATSLRRFGLIRGSWLTIRRLGRCNPWNPGGVDHVPNREESNSGPIDHRSAPSGSRRTCTICTVTPSSPFRSAPPRTANFGGSRGPRRTARRH